jgi:hypothetical protein
MLENSINNNVDPSPLVAKSIEKDIDTARTHLNNHVTTEEEILTLDKNCEYCQIYQGSEQLGHCLGFSWSICCLFGIMPYASNKL